MDGQKLLRLAGALTAAFGLIGLFAPQLIAMYADFGANSSAARSEIRAVFGGCFVMLGAVLAASASSLQARPMAKLVGLAYLGMMGGRVLSLVLDSPLNFQIWLAMIVEGALAWCIFTGLRRLEMQDSAA